MIGPDADLAIDANMAWTPQQALKMIRKWESLGLAFVEEPVICDDLDGMAYVAEHTSIPIAAGENVYTRYEFKKLLERGTASIIQPDVTRTGGILEAKIIAAMADAWGLKCAPHFYSGAVGLAATLHLLASTPDGLFLEYDATENALRDGLLK
jgi:L-alanine-DL-glutamate epimerase-like enolase superfamily enzyme